MLEMVAARYGPLPLLGKVSALAAIGVMPLDAWSMGMLWMVIDHSLALTMLSGALWYPLIYSLTWRAERAELFAVRVTSSLLATGAASALVVQLMPRPMLCAATALYVGLSLNLSAWCAELWLSLQASGLRRLLPPSAVHWLEDERPIDWLRRDEWSRLVRRVRQLLPLLVLPDSELEHGLALLPDDFRRALEAPGLQVALTLALTLTLTRTLTGWRFCWTISDARSRRPDCIRPSPRPRPKPGVEA